MYARWPKLEWILLFVVLEWNVAPTQGLILIVNDSLPDRDLWSLRLQRNGCTTVTADGSEEALRVIGRQDLDVVLLDVTMGDGLSVLEQVRLNRSMSELPVIIVTSTEDRSDIARGFQLGANDYVTKPLDFPVTLSRIQTQLMVKKMSAELQAARGKMNADLQLAARLHRSIIPMTPPDIPNVQFSWGFYPCEDLAGDVLEMIQLDQDHVGCYILDVSGRGVDAALLALDLSRTFSHMAPESLLYRRTSSGEIEIVPPAAVASTLNRKFCTRGEERHHFALLYGVLNVLQREFRYVSAGYTGALHLPYGDKPRALPSGGCAIGWLHESSFEENVVQLGPGDRLYLYSDGIPRAANPAGDAYGDRLMIPIHEGKDHTLDNSIAWLVYDVREWCGQMPPQDDLAILAIEMSK